MKVKFWLIGLILFGFSFLNTLPVSAASASVVSINFFGVNCAGTSITLNLKVQVNANAVDYNFGSDFDLFEVVFYDGAGTAFAYKATLIGTGSNGTYDIGYSIFMNLPSYRPFTIKLFDLTAFPADFTEAQAGPLLDTFTFDPNDFTITPCTDLPLYVAPTAPDASDPQPPFADGRLNNWDTASPAVVFGHDFETGRGLVVYSPEGALLLAVRPEQITAVEECPAENTLIASAGNVALYRLSSCEYQLNAPSLDGTKTYVLIFNDLYENTGYSSHEE